MPEIDLLKRYPKTKRDHLLTERETVSETEREYLRTFPKEYFDGTRRQGLGGYHYDPRFWTPVVEDMVAYYGLNEQSSILDVGCAKGFMLYDFTRVVPGITVAGIDISDYALSQAKEEVKPFLLKASCDALPFIDNSFDLVVSIATIHNLDIHVVKRSLKEIMRVTRKHAFIKVNGARNEKEKIAFDRWNIVAKTSLYVEQWQVIFDQVGYTGDYCWFTP